MKCTCATFCVCLFACLWLNNILLSSHPFLLFCLCLRYQYWNRRYCICLSVRWQRPFLQPDLFDKTKRRKIRKKYHKTVTVDLTPKKCKCIEKTKQENIFYRAKRIKTTLWIIIFHCFLEEKNYQHSQQHDVETRTNFALKTSFGLCIIAFIDILLVIDMRQSRATIGNPKNSVAGVELFEFKWTIATDNN